MGGSRHKAIRRLAVAVAYAALFVAATVVGLVLHLDLPPARRAIIGIVNESLQGALAGTLRVSSLDHVGFDGVEGVDLSAFSPEGKPVLCARSADVQVSLLPLVWSLIRREGPVRVALPRASLREVEVWLDRTSEGDLALARTFASPPSAAPSEPGRGVDLHIPRIRLSRAFLHVRLEDPGFEAAVEDLQASLRSRDAGTVIDVHGAGLSASDLPIPDVSGSMNGRIAIRPDEPLSARSNLDVHVGDVPVRIGAQFADDRLLAGVLVPPTEPYALREIVPGLPLTKPASLRVCIEGTLPNLEATGQWTLGRRTTRFGVHADLSSSISLDLHAALADFDPRAFHPEAPEADADIELTASVSSLSEEPSGTFDVWLQRGTMEGHALPRTRVHGSFLGSSVQGKLDARKHDASVDATFAVTPLDDDTGMRVVSSLDASLPSFAVLPPLAGDVRGSGRLHADVTLTLADTSRIEGHVRADASHVNAGGVGLARGSLRASVLGPLDAPWVNATTEGRGLRTPMGAVSHYRVDVEGPARAPLVELRAATDRVGRLRASTALEIGETVVASGTTIRVDGALSLRASARRVSAGGDAVVVEALRLEGLGGPVEAGLEWRRNRLGVRAHAANLQIARLAPFLGPSLPDVRGVVSLDVDLGISRRHLDGHARVDLAGGRIHGLVDDAEAEIDLRAREDRLDVTAEATVDGVSKVALEARDVALRGSPWSPESWRRASGRASLDVTLDLSHAGRALPPGALPVRKLAGEAHVRARWRRPRADAAALIDVAASTTGLEMILRGSQSAAPTRIRGVDAQTAIFADLSGGQVDLSAALEHAGGYLVQADLETRLPFDVLVQEPARAMQVASDSVWTGSVVVPRQPLGSLPAFMRPSGIEGRVEGAITVEGPIRAPLLVLRSSISEARLGDHPDLDTVPLDVTLTGRLDRNQARASAQVGREGRTVALVESDLDLDIASWMNGELPPDWELSTQVDLDQFPLRALAGLLGRPIDGCLQGHARLEGLHRDASLHAELWSDEIRTGQAGAVETQLQVHMEKDELSAGVRVGRGRGGVDATVATGVVWGAEIVPRLAPKAGVRGRLRADGFDLATLREVLGVGEIEGQLDADMFLQAPAQNLEAGRAEGYLRIADGVIDDARIGQRMHGVNAEIRIDDEGGVRIERLEARTPSGLLTAAAAVRLDGLQPVTSRTVLRVPEGSPFPLVFDGVDYGSVVGDVEVTTKWGRQLDVEAVIPKMHFELPPQPSAQVQGLDPDETIDIGKVTSKGHFEPYAATEVAPETSNDSEPDDAGTTMPMRIRVRLGDDVFLSRGTDLRAQVKGDTTVELGRGEPRIRGSIEIPRGKVDLRGRQFDIVRATLSVNEEEPGNPIVSATAKYDAPGDYTVTAQFTGTVKSGELTLSSTPSLPRSQILSLIVFGTPEGPAGADSGGGGAAAAGLVGGKVSQGVNAFIGDVTSMDVQTRLDTSHEDVRPEVAVQVSRKVLAQVTFVPTEPSPGQNPDRTFLTLEYRFLPRWTLEVSVGDEGTSLLDLLWRHRY